MKYPTVFHLVAKEFKKAGVPHVLIGGFAVNAYKVVRQTQDVDFMILEGHFEKVRAMLEENGFRLAERTDLFVRFQNHTASLIDLDLIFTDEETLKKICEAGKKTTIAGLDFIIPSLEHLMALKLHAVKSNQPHRLFKDLPDIIRLMRLYQVDPRGQNFKELCSKFGNQEIYEMILKAFPEEK